jgi:hypothetical protein
LKIIVYNQEWDILDEVSLPLQMQWNGAPTKMGRQPAEWVQKLNVQQQTMAIDSMEQPPASTGMPLWGLLITLMALLVLTCLLIIWWMKRTSK